MLSIQLFKGGVLVREIRTDEGLLTLGRDAGASIVIEDPEKLISRQHASIERRDGVSYLIVHSRVNPVLVDGRVLRAGQATVLAEGARVTMSPYEMVVSSAADGSGPTSPSSAGAQAVPQGLAVEVPVGGTMPPGYDQPDGGMEQATRAFLRGLGLAHLRIPVDEQAFFLERAGVMMLVVAEALAPMLAARARLRRGLSVSDDTQAPENPLLEASTPTEVLALLVDPARQAPGAMDSMQALREASVALRRHPDALLSGTRAALVGLLQALDPAAIDAVTARTAGPLGLNRRTRAWEGFVAVHAALLQQAATDPDALLQGDFLAAYLQRLSLPDD
jgi:predicted component of type VI protein secretion system